MTIVSAAQHAEQERHPHRPSIRKRLFSLSSRKSGKRVKNLEEEEEKAGQGVVRAIENSGSAGITLTLDPPAGSEEGQGPVFQQPSTSAASPDAASPTQTDDNDKEQGSLNTTLSGHKRVPFYRRKANKSTLSEGALSSTTSHSISKQKARLTKPRPSLLSRVVYKVVPCVGSKVADDPVQQDDTMTEYKAPREVSGVKSSELVPLPSSLDNHQGPPPIDTSQALMVPAFPTQPDSPAESEVIVPPPPSAQLLPEEETDGVTSGAVQPPGSTGDAIARTFTRDSDDSDGTHFTDDEVDDSHSLEEQAEEERLIRNGGSGIPIGPDGVPRPLLPPIAPEHAGRKCLVLDLDETLVHSSFKPIPHPDFIVPVEIEAHWHHFHVLKRPGVDMFLKEMGEIYEIVVFTASLSKYADPVLDQLDISKVVAHRLFRESCFSHNGNYVKDLSQLGRPIADTIILDNSPASYIFHPTNAVPVSSWFNDPHDAELTDLIPFLADLTAVPDVRPILDSAR